MQTSGTAWSGRASASYRAWMLVLGPVIAIFGIYLAVVVAPEDAVASWVSALLCLFVGAFVAVSAVAGGRILVVTVDEADAAAVAARTWLDPHRG